MISTFNSRSIPLMVFGVMVGFICKGQTFQTYVGSNGTETGEAIYQTSDGGYLMGGTSNGFGNSTEMYAIRLDASGDTLWTKTYGGTGQDQCKGVGEYPDGSLGFMGLTYSFGQSQSDFYAVKTDANGDTLWTKVIGGTGNDRCNHGIITSDGGMALTGYTTGFGAGNRAVYIVKLDTFGILEWAELYGGPNNDEAHYIAETSDGGFIVTGYTDSYDVGGSDAYAIKVDAAGNFLWSRVYGETGFDDGRAVIETLDSGFVFLAETGNGTGNRSFLAIRTDINGDTLWTKDYGGPSTSEYPRGIIQLPDTGFIMCGYSSGMGPGGTAGYLVRTDANGDTLWTRAVGGSSMDYFYNIAPTSDSGVVMIGNTFSFGANFGAFWGVKMDANGSVGCNEYGVATQLSQVNPVQGTGGSHLNTGGVFEGTPTIFEGTPSNHVMICAPPCSAEVYGVVMTGASPVNNGIVQLLRNMPAQLALDTIQSTSVNASGEFTFAGVDTGSYLVRIVPDDLSYPTAMATYHPQTHRWDSATVVVVGCNVDDTANIQLVDPGSSTGDGTFSGTISYTNGYRSFGEDRGEPIPGLEVVIERSPSGVVAGSDITDTSGNYDVGNLAPDDYVIHVDFPGLGHFATYSLTITPTDTVFTNLDFWINEDDAIYTLDPEANIQENLKLNLLIYPNPATEVLNIVGDPDVPIDEIKLYDITGHLILQMSQGISEHTVLDISDLQAGIYFTEIRAQNKALTRKVVVQR